MVKYIEMCSRNFNKQINNPVGEDKVLIFDIDQCLYHSPELNEYDLNSTKNTYIQLSKLTEKEWNDHYTKYNLFREIFYFTIGVHPKDFSKYEDEHPPSFIEKDEDLKNVLQSIKIRKFCFTNGTSIRASKILQHMEIEDQFECVICCDSEETEFICKPQKTSYEFVERYLGIKNRSNVYFFDDSEKNIKGAADFGWNSFLVSNGNIKELLKEYVGS